MARIIMCGSFKGGVGKTASSWNLAYSLAEMGKRVLAVDFDSQANLFSMARSAASTKLPPVYVYAVETAIQMTLTELNENLREIYIEAYTQKEACEYIQRETAKELYQIFGSYQPDLTERDFYELEIGSAGIMRGYMAHPCDAELTLEKKLRLFFTMSLRAYNVPEEEIGRVIRFVEGLDIRAISEQVMQKLFKALAMHYEFSLQGIM